MLSTPDVTGFPLSIEVPTITGGVTSGPGLTQYLNATIAPSFPFPLASIHRVHKVYVPSLCISGTTFTSPSSVNGLGTFNVCICSVRNKLVSPTNNGPISSYNPTGTKLTLHCAGSFVVNPYSSLVKGCKHPSGLDNILNPVLGGLIVLSGT